MAHQVKVEKEFERKEKKLERMEYAPVDKNDARHMKRLQEERE